MATNQMEESLLLKARDKAIGAIIERFPHNDLYIEGDDIVLCECYGKPARELMFDAKVFSSDWDDLTHYTEDIAYYSEPIPDDGYYWIDKQYRRGCIDDQPYTWIATCEERLS